MHFSIFPGVYSRGFALRSVGSGSLRLGWKELFFGKSNTSDEFLTVRSRGAVSLSHSCLETCNGVDLSRHTFWPAAAAVMRTVSLSMTHSGMQLI